MNWKLSTKQLNALAVVRDCNPYAGCVTGSQISGRRKTLYVLQTMDLVTPAPWQLTKEGKDALNK